MQTRLYGSLTTFLGIILFSTALCSARVDADSSVGPADPRVGQTAQLTDTSAGDPSASQWTSDPRSGVADTADPSPTRTAPASDTVDIERLVPAPSSATDIEIEPIWIEPIGFEPTGLEPTGIEIIEIEPPGVEASHIFSDDFETGDLCAWSDQTLCTPLFRFTSSAFAVAEDGVSVEIMVERYRSSDGAVSVRCASTDGTASEGNDYLATLETLSWADGESGPKPCTVDILDDGLTEGDETMILSLSNPINGSVGSPGSAVLTIEDDDGAGELRFSSETFTIGEAAGTALATVQRAGGDAGTVTVRCSTANGTAVATVDYVPAFEILEWEDGDGTDKPCPVPIINDSMTEPDETVLLILNDPTGGAAVGTPNTATLTILDDDDDARPGELSFSSTTYTADEGVATAIITVRRLNGSDGAISVRCDTADGTATAGADYSAIMATLSWADGETANKTCTIPILDDSIDEPNETVLLSLSNVTGGATLGTPNTATLTILDNDEARPGQLCFSATTYTVDEAGTAFITVRRLNGSDGAVSVRCNTANGTATAAVDYIPTVDTLSWADGETTDKICSVPILVDSIDEPNETILFSLSNVAGGATLCTPNTATLTILDDDDAQPGQLSFSASTYTVDEDAGNAFITVRRLNGSDGAVSVRCDTANGTATAGADYTATLATVIWADGDATNKTCAIPILDDSIDEPNETVLLSLSNVTGGATLGTPNTATLTILDDDEAQPGQLSFSASTYTVDEDAGSAFITVRRLNGSDGAVSVRCDTANGTATAGADYTATLATVIWADGDATNKTCAIPILDDSIDEPNETVLLSLSNATGGATLGTPNTATLTILDDDEVQPGQLSFSATSPVVDEDAGNAFITVRRLNGSDGAVSVRCDTADGTATAGADYTSTMATVSWADGDATNKTCTIPILDDSIDEPNETVLLSLSNATGGATLGTPNTATLTILDDDEIQPGELSFSASTYTVDESGDSATITVRRLNGSDGAVSVRCDTANGTATADVDYMGFMETLTWADGETADKTCAVRIRNDDIEESNETVLLSLSNLTGGATLGTPSTATLTILDDDELIALPQGEFSFVSALHTVDENVGSVLIAVQRLNGSAGAATILCETTGGTATAGADYFATAANLTWADGEAGVKPCLVQIVDDPITDPFEEIELTLSAVTSGAQVVSPSVAIVVINDNERCKDAIDPVICEER